MHKPHVVDVFFPDCGNHAPPLHIWTRFNLDFFTMIILTKFCKIVTLKYGEIDHFCPLDPQNLKDFFFHEDLIRYFCADRCQIFSVPLLPFEGGALFGQKTDE